MNSKNGFILLESILVITLSLIIIGPLTHLVVKTLQSIHTTRQQLLQSTEQLTIQTLLQQDSLQAVAILETGSTLTLLNQDQQPITYTLKNQILTRKVGTGTAQTLHQLLTFSTFQSIKIPPHLIQLSISNNLTNTHWTFYAPNLN